MKEGKKFLYYLIEVGRYKNSYKEKFRSTIQSQAIIYYNGINIGNGYKKRFVAVWEDQREIIARRFS